MTKFITSAYMRWRVKRGYNTNNYNEVYRDRDTLTDFEGLALSSFFTAMNMSKPAVLDIGCGAGVPYDTYLVSQGCELYGIDISKAQIARAKQNVPSAKYVIADFMSCKLSRQFDGIMMLYSLFHMPCEKHADIMRKVYNLLTPDGKVLLNIGVKDSGRLKIKQNFCGKPMCWSHYDADTFLSILTKVGFSYKILGNEKSYGSDENHIWLILSKKDN